MGDTVIPATLTDGGLVLGEPTTLADVIVAEHFGKDCLACYSFPNECSRPAHDCPDRQLKVSLEVNGSAANRKS